MMDTASQYLRQLLDCGSGKGLLSALIGFFASVLGGVGPLFMAMCLLWSIDFLLGFTRAISECDVDNRKMVRGAGKIVLYCITILVAALFDYVFAQVNPFAGIHIPIRDGIVAYLCLTETISCLNHLAALGVRLPAWIATRLAGYRTAMDAGPSSSSGGSK
jgi:phage-related holin